MSLARRRGPAMNALVREGRWQDRYKGMPVDLYGKTVLIVGFGKIGTRSTKRFAAMETNVQVYDPYMCSETIRGMDYEPVLLPLQCLQISTLIGSELSTRSPCAHSGYRTLK